MKLSWAIVLAIQNPKSKIQNRIGQSGFTLMECLIAIAIVSILMTVVAPLITLAVSNRVQARRIELATQAARAYVTGVESGIITPPQHLVQLTEVDDENNFVAQRFVFAGIAPPATNGGLSCPNAAGNSYCLNTLTSSLYCVDVDSNGCSSNSAQDLVVQAFRSVTPNSTDAEKGYLIGLRVYRTDGFSDDGPLVKSDPENRRTQAVFTGGLGNLKAPLVEMSTEIVPQQATLRDFCDRFGCQDTQNIGEE
jgi:prepilin-type N-terminal cleavage/methylation domain-containing protein